MKPPKQIRIETIRLKLNSKLSEIFLIKENGVSVVFETIHRLKGVTVKSLAKFKTKNEAVKEFMKLKDSYFEQGYVSEKIRQLSFDTEYYLNMEEPTKKKRVKKEKQTSKGIQLSF